MNFKNVHKMAEYKILSNDLNYFAIEYIKNCNIIRLNNREQIVEIKQENT